MTNPSRKLDETTENQREYIAAGWHVIELDMRPGPYQGKRPIHSNWQAAPFRPEPIPGAMAFGVIVAPDVLVVASTLATTDTYPSSACPLTSGSTSGH